MASSRSSAVWQYYLINSVDNSRDTCKLCNVSLARGGKGAKNSYGTTNLRKHLQSKHDAEYREMMEKDHNTRSTTRPTCDVPSTSHAATATVNEPKQQMTIKAVFDSKRPWGFDDERSRHIHRLVGEMIAVDDQPFNIVNNKGLSLSLLFIVTLQSRCFSIRRCNHVICWIKLYTMCFFSGCPHT